MDELKQTLKQLLIENNWQVNICEIGESAHGPDDLDVLLCVFEEFADKIGKSVPRLTGHNKDRQQAIVERDELIAILCEEYNWELRKQEAGIILDALERV